jgi:hypothetical protein
MRTVRDTEDPVLNGISVILAKKKRPPNAAGAPVDTTCPWRKADKVGWSNNPIGAKTLSSTCSINCMSSRKLARYSPKTDLRMDSKASDRPPHLHGARGQFCRTRRLRSCGQHCRRRSNVAQLKLLLAGCQAAGELVAQLELCDLAVFNRLEEAPLSSKSNAQLQKFNRKAN